MDDIQALLGDHPLNKEFNDVMTENELLAKQNRLFEACLRRMEIEMERHPEIKDVEHRRDRRQHARHQQQELSLSQLMQLSVTESEERKKQLEDLKENVTRDISLLKAIIEATKIRINEMRKEAYEFKRDIVVGGADAQTGQIMAEKVIRYYQEKKKQKQGLLEKLRGKNHSLKVYRKKMDQQVRQKKESEGNLLKIDFHQLQIKNSQCLAKRAEKDADLVQLKANWNKTSQALTKQKRKLNELTEKQEKLVASIEHRLTVLRRLDPKSRKSAIDEGIIKATKKNQESDLGKVEKEVDKEKKRNKMFKIQQSNPDMPQVLDYVNQKSQLYDLEASVRNWQRKVEIIEMAAKRARATIRRIENQGFEIDEQGNVNRAGGGPRSNGNKTGVGYGNRGIGKGRLSGRGTGRGAQRGLNVGGSAAMRPGGPHLPPIDLSKSNNP